MTERSAPENSISDVLEPRLLLNPQQLSKLILKAIKLKKEITPGDYYLLLQQRTGPEKSLVGAH